MTIVSGDFRHEFCAYLENDDLDPFFVLGDALRILRDLPDSCIDFCMTSPPYWGKRQYDSEGIGLEAEYKKYVAALIAIFEQVKRVMKSTGSFWLNIGDTYFNKQLGMNNDQVEQLYYKNSGLLGV